MKSIIYAALSIPYYTIVAIALQGYSRTNKIKNMHMRIILIKTLAKKKFLRCVFS